MMKYIPLFISTFLSVPTLLQVLENGISLNRAGPLIMSVSVTIMSITFAAEYNEVKKEPAPILTMILAMILLIFTIFS